MPRLITDNAPYLAPDLHCPACQCIDCDCDATGYWRRVEAADESDQEYPDDGLDCLAPGAGDSAAVLAGGGAARGRRQAG